MGEFYQLPSGVFFEAIPYADDDGVGMAAGVYGFCCGESFYGDGAVAKYSQQAV